MCHRLIFTVVLFCMLMVFKRASHHFGDLCPVLFAVFSNLPANCLPPLPEREANAPGALGQARHPRWDTKCCFLSLAALDSIFFPPFVVLTAEQPQEKVSATPEVFRGGSYLGQAGPKSVVALRGDR